MKKLYPTCAGKLCLCVILASVFSFSSSAQKMVTYDTTFGGWNAIVTMDAALTGTDSAPGIVFFPGIGEMTTHIADLSKNGPHYLINNGMWDGSVTLGNGVHHPFIISLQPPGCCYPANSVKPLIDAILKRYRIKRKSFYLTGLSMGGWQANQFICYEPTKGDDTYGKMIKAVVVLEGVEPVDSTAPYPSLGYPRKMGHWAKACGGRELWVEGSQDWRDMLAGAQNMNDSVTGSATYFQVTYGGGAHCCWNTEYQPSTTWTIPTNSNISQLVGTPQPMNVWQWLLRQGDTSMPANEGNKVVVTGAPPTVSAGKGQVITLPTTSTMLTGTATGNGGSTISGLTWKFSSGPATAAIGSSASLSTVVSGMTVAGSYVFTLYASDNSGQSSNASMTVTVNPVSAASPTVSAGKGQLISLPATSTTLAGSATSNSGAAIVGLNWKQVGGPSAAAISAPTSLHTAVSGMKTSGSYIFMLTATDNQGNSANGSMTVTISATGTAATRTAAMAGQAIVMNDSAAGTDPLTSDPPTGVQLYPNPVHDLLNVSLNSVETGKIVIAIYNGAGNRVFTAEEEKPGPVLLRAIDVNGLPRGLYVVRVIAGPNSRNAGKFIKL